MPRSRHESSASDVFRTTDPARASQSNLRGVICRHLLPLASDKVAFEFKYTPCLGADGPHTSSTKREERRRGCALL